MKLLSSGMEERQDWSTGARAAVGAGGVVERNGRGSDVPETRMDTEFFYSSILILYFY